MQLAVVEGGSVEGHVGWRAMVLVRGISGCVWIYSRD